jgi:hypothetical protein
MKYFFLGRHRVKVYDSIDELPMARFHKYNKFLLIDAGLGSDMQSFDAHIEKVVRFMRTGDTDNAAKELENMRQNIYVMQTEQSPQNLSFAALVAEIDDVEMNDLSDDGLERVRQMLLDAPRKDITAALQAVKKKIDDDLMLYFPSLFDSTDEKEYYDMMKRRAQMELEQITDGDSEERRARITELEDRMVTAVKPRTFTGRDAFGVQHDKAYMKMCLMISSNLNADATRMTVLEYYTASEYMHEMAKERQKAVSKAGKGARV